MSGDMLFGYPVVLVDGPAPGPDDIVLGYPEARRATLRWAMPGGYERVLVLGEAARESLRRGQVPSALRVWLAESAQVATGEEEAT